MRLDDVPGDGESQPGAAAFGAGAVGFVEALEDARQVVGVDACAGITDIEADIFSILPGKEPNFTARRGEFDGVVDEVDQHLFEATGVGWYGGEVRIAFGLQVEPGAFGLGFHAVGSGLEQLRGGDGLELERDLPRFDAREFEQFGGHLGQGVNFGLHARQEAAGGGRVIERAILQGFGQGFERGERGA
mgnify:CR=1 FL=1